jgi:hypothetical protein
VHNTLGFPRLLFEVLVRFGVGECFGVYLSIVCSSCLRCASRIRSRDSFPPDGFLRPADPTMGKMIAWVPYVLSILASLLCFGGRLIGAPY